MNLRLDNKKEIELIDFPGLASNKNNYYIEKEMKKLLKNENAFIFVKKGKEMNTHQSAGTVQFVYDIIKEKNFFNINNCLFLYTHLEELKSSMEEITKSLLKIFEDQTKDQCKIMRKKNKDFINKKKLIITKFDSLSYENYLHFEGGVENFRNFFEDLINKSKQEKEDFYNYIDYYLISNNFRKFSENYNNMEIKKTENQQEYIKNLTNMFSEYKINIKHKEIKKFVDYYLKIKENKKLYYPFIESNYEEMLEQLKKIFNNIEIMLNETLNNQIHSISEKIFETFNLVRIFVELNIDKEEKQNIKNELNDIVDKFNFSYTVLNNKTDERFENYEKKIGEIKISEFEYNEDKELYLKSVENAKEKYKKIIVELNNNLLENDIYYFRIYSKKLLKDFMDKIEKIKEEKEINKNSSDDTVKITNIIENNKIISDINLQKININRI